MKSSRALGPGCIITEARRRLRSFSTASARCDGASEENSARTRGPETLFTFLLFCRTWRSTRRRSRRSDGLSFEARQRPSSSIFPTLSGREPDVAASVGLPARVQCSVHSRNAESSARIFHAGQQRPAPTDGSVDPLTGVSNGALGETFVAACGPLGRLVLVHPCLRPATRLRSRGQRHVHGCDRSHLTAWNRFQFVGRRHWNPARRNRNPLSRSQPAGHLFDRHNRIARHRHDMRGVGEFVIGTDWIGRYV